MYVVDLIVDEQKIAGRQCVGLIRNLRGQVDWHLNDEGWDRCLKWLDLYLSSGVSTDGEVRVSDSLGSRATNVARLLERRSDLQGILIHQ